MNHGRIPSFEGHPVSGTGIKFSGAAPLDDLEGEVYGIDDVVQVIAQYRVTNVKFEVNGKGELIRVHVLTPVLMTPFSLNEDPEGEYVIRAIPHVEVKQIEKKADEPPEGVDLETGELGSSLREGESLTITTPTGESVTINAPVHPVDADNPNLATDTCETCPEGCPDCTGFYCKCLIDHEAMEDA